MPAARKVQSPGGYRRFDLRGVVLAGFATGTGEVARYLAAHGPGRVTAAVLVAPLLPFLFKANDNPEGIGRSVFDRLTARIAADRPAAMVAEQLLRGHLRVGPRRSPLCHSLPGRLPGGSGHDQHPRPDHPRRRL